MEWKEIRISDLLKKAQRLKELAEKRRQQADKAQGALDSLLSQLRKEHGLKSLEEAEAYLLKLTKELEQVKRELEKTLEEYERKWGSKLGG